MDFRDRAAIKGKIKPPVIELRPDDDCEDYIEEYDTIELPWKWGVCPTCDGRGKYVNPSIDSNGITGSEMAELGPEFEDSYFSGAFDITCVSCDGRTTVPVINRDACDTVTLREYDQQQREQREYEQELAYEADMRSRGIEF